MPLTLGQISVYSSNYPQFVTDDPLNLICLGQEVVASLHRALRDSKAICLDASSTGEDAHGSLRHRAGFVFVCNMA
jgi:hypothetical protein